MDEKTQSVTELAWKILYKEEREEVPDPNRPENTAYFNAKRKERREAISRFVTGQGKILYEQWMKQIKGLNLALLVTPDQALCKCPACVTIAQIKARLELILEAELILAEAANDKA